MTAAEGLGFPALMTTVVLWAAAFPAIHVGVAGLGVAGLTVVRLAIASAALALAAPVLNVRLPRRRDLPPIVLCGAAGLSAYQLLLNWGELRVPAGTASLLIASAPVFSTLAAAVCFGERLSRDTVLGSVIALAGAALIWLGSGSTRIGLSALAVLGAAVVQGVYHLASKPLLARYTAFEVVCYAMWTGTALVLPLAPAALHAVAAAPPEALGSAVALALLPSAVGYVTWGYALARYSVARSTAGLYLVSPVAILVSFVWLGETPRPVELAGGAVSIAGVALIRRPARRRRVARRAGLTRLSGAPGRPAP